MVTLADLHSRNKAGKAVLTVPKGASVIPAAAVGEAGSLLAAVSTDGRLLLFDVEELPELARGKGNKLINVPTAAFKAREEFVIAVNVLTKSDELVVFAGQRHLRIRFKDLDNYLGERARRGRKLPRGFQKVDALIVEGSD